MTIKALEKKRLDYKADRLILFKNKCEDAVKAKAKERQACGQGGVLLVEKFPQANAKARDELGKMAGGANEWSISCELGIRV